MMFAVTERLLLRPGWPEEAEALAAAVAHEAVVMRLARAPWPYGVEDARRFLGHAWSDVAPCFLITERERGGAPIGCIGIHDEAGGAELGYWLTPAAWGRGYATEAGRAVVAVARDTLRLPRLRATWFVGNDASGRVLAKLGFRSTGRVVRQHSLAQGRDVDANEVLLDLAMPAALAA